MPKLIIKSSDNISAQKNFRELDKALEFALELKQRKKQTSVEVYDSDNELVYSRNLEQAPKSYILQCSW